MPKKIGIVKIGCLFVLSVIVATLFFAALQFPEAEVYAGTISPENRLSLTQPRDSGQWKSNDLSIEYSYSRDQGKLDLSGTVRFSYSLVHGYSRVQDFRFGAIFLDENGRNLEEIGLVTNRGPLEPVSFHRQIDLPSNAAYMAFSYQGILIETGHEGGKGSTSIWFSPVR